MSKKKNKKPQKIIIDSNKKTIEPLVKKINLEDTPYYLELMREHQILNEEFNQKSLRAEALKKYLESDHHLYENIKGQAFNIQRSNINYDTRKEEVSSFEGDYVFFDFENNVYASKKVYQMPECYLGDSDNIHICKENGIYIEKEHYSSSRLFLSDKKQIDKNQNYIKSFDKILDDIISDIKLEDKYTYFCMLPESIDVFNTKIRRCLNTSKGKIISIPKSVAVTYAVLDDLRIGDRYCVVDMDGLHPIVTQLSIGRDEHRRKIILREGFIRNNSIKYDYVSFASDYLKLFEDKYLITFTDNERLMLIQNKRLYQVFIKKEPITLFREDKKIKIIFDERIYAECIKKYFTDNCEFARCDRVYIVSSLIGLIKGDTLIHIDNSAAFKGLELIRDKLLKDENAIIWKERLPKVSLEVIDDNTGRFKTIDLIEEENEGQSIRLSVDEEIELPFKGTITLQKGKKEYYLPLEREIYAEDINSAKEAYFYDKSFPLDNDVLVELVVKYNYMSESPIKIYARPKRKNSKFSEIANTWVDPHEIELYSGPIYDGHVKEIQLPYTRVITRTEANMTLFLNKRANIYEYRFERQPVGGKVHGDLILLNSAYHYLRSTFDSDNVKTTDFKNFYADANLEKFFHTTYRVIKAGDALYGSDFINQVSKYKAIIKRCISDIIVASWYYDKNNEDINNIYNYLSNCDKCKIYIRLTRCIKYKKDDIYSVFDKLTDKLSSYFSGGYQDDIFDDRMSYVRTLSQNCWFNKNWLKQFYGSKNGSKAVELISEYIFDYLKNGNFRTDKEYRDIMEFLVCLTMTKNIDKNLFNPNDNRTRELLTLVKSSYEKANSIIAEDQLVSRLDIEQDQGALFGYPNYIYILIIVLSGEGQVNLVGYHDE